MLAQLTRCRKGQEKDNVLQTHKITFSIRNAQAEEARAMRKRSVGNGEASRIEARSRLVK